MTYIAASWALLKSFHSAAGEEALTMYMDKSRLDRKSGNATQSVEALHQLASSYFVDRDGTMRRLHEIQISTGAIKVLYLALARKRRLCVRSSTVAIWGRTVPVQCDVFFNHNLVFLPKLISQGKLFSYGPYRRIYFPRASNIWKEVDIQCDG